MTTQIITKNYHTPFEYSISTISSKDNEKVFAKASVSQNGYNNLPIDVLCNIFKYFDEKELRTNIIPVCQKWKKAALQPELWKTLEIKGKRIPTNFICGQLRMFPKLQKITLKNIAEPTIVIRQICRCNRNLKHLILRKISPPSENCLRNLIKCCRNLETLDMEGIEFTGQIFYEDLSILQNLKCINFSSNPKITTQNLMTVLLNCHSLEFINLSQFPSSLRKNPLGDADTSFMILNVASTLKSLILDSITLGDRAFQSIFNCSKLEKLYLYGASNLSGKLFRNIWRYLPKLKELQIRQAHQITNEDMISVFTEGKHVMRNLQVLDFTGCWKIKNDSIEVMLKCCSDLKSLSLKSCKGINDFSIIQKHSPELEYLNIAYCNFDFKNLTPLPGKLKVLIINKANLLLEIASNLKNENPGLEIHACVSEYNTDMINLNNS